MKRNARKIRAHHKFSPAEISDVERFNEDIDPPGLIEFLKHGKGEKIAPVHRAKGRNKTRFAE